MQNATAHTDFSHLRRFYFNPHTHAGCDKKNIAKEKCTMISIHTSVRDATKSRCKYVVHILYFNPRRERQAHRLDHPLSFYDFNPHTHAGSD